VPAVDLSFEEGKEGATDAPSALSLVMITARVNVPHNRMHQSILGTNGRLLEPFQCSGVDSCKSVTRYVS
jgi:hypothetical protein